MPDEAAAVDEVALMTRGWTWPYDESTNGAEPTATREPSNSIDELMSQPAAAAQEQEKQALQELQRRSNDTDKSIETDVRDDTAKHVDHEDAKAEQPAAQSHGEQQQPYARASLARASLSSPRLSLAVAESAWKTITARLKPRPSAAVDARRRLLEDSADDTGGVVLFSRENDARRKEQQEAEERSQHVSLQSRYLYIARAKAEAKAKARAEKRAATAASVESARRERVQSVAALFGEEPASDSELPEERIQSNRWGTPFQDGDAAGHGHGQDEEDEEEDQARGSEREEEDTDLVAAPPVCVQLEE